MPVPFSVRYLETGSSDADRQYPYTAAIRSLDALHVYHDANKYDDQLVAIPDSLIMVGFTDVAGSFDAVFFEENALVLVMLKEGSSSIAHRVSRVWTKGDTLRIDIDRLLPGGYDDSEGMWYVIIEVPQSSLDGRQVSVQMSDVPFDETDMRPFHQLTLWSGGARCAAV